MQTPPAGGLNSNVSMQQLLGFSSASLRAVIACSLCGCMLQYPANSPAQSEEQWVHTECSRCALSSHHGHVSCAHLPVRVPDTHK